MERPVYDESNDGTILDQVHEGMSVYDSAGNEVGKVREVYLGAVSDKMDQRGIGPATASAPEWRDETLIDYVAEIFADDPLPEVVRDRLLRYGFIRIDTSGLFASDRFATADQVGSVTDEGVRLNVAKDDLIES